jgi:hypothetical protein
MYHVDIKNYEIFATTTIQSNYNTIGRCQAKLGRPEEATPRRSGTRSAAPRGSTHAEPQGRTARTAPAASATIGRCRGGRGRETFFHGTEPEKPGGK